MHALTTPSRLSPFVAAAMFLCAVAGTPGCNQPTAPRTPEARQTLREDARSELRAMEREDPGLRDFLRDRAHGYAVFPKVAKGGVLVGGAYGRGTVYRGEEFVGYAELNQANVGLIIGGNTFSEVLAFESEGDLNEFMNRGETTLGAEATAVFIQAGVSAKANFQNGMAVFVRPHGGLIADLSIVGQKFNFRRSEPGEAGGAESGTDME